MTRKLSLSCWENKLGVILLFGVGTQSNLQDGRSAYSNASLSHYKIRRSHKKKAIYPPIYTNPRRVR
ncbi:hypothetical protein [Nostoc sp. ChiVER01]|uniref:hypothetical protein n=1 Tax=Nostoc sp. ChiVER01 TaxID=3075382 RepID=UPI002AD2810B|nr:hypothetical protein [Nostoc sp. ChiVER01]MDZ8228308.1 hypothetical protein [Nostoc sp. ChiVER01]